MKNRYLHRVIRWSTPSGLYLSVCGDCEAWLTVEGTWPRAATGEEYCTVSMGAHRGLCEAPCHAAYTATHPHPQL